MSRARLSSDEILEQAGKLVDAEGVDALTMRRLAGELGVSPMTLYGHFRTKDELLDGVADMILGQLALPAPDPADGVASVLHLAQALRALMQRHPSVVRLWTSPAFSTSGALRGGVEAPLAFLRAAGFDGELTVRLYGAVLTYTLGFTLYQLPLPWGGDHPDVAEERRRRRAFYESLPLAEFPNLVALAEPMTTVAGDEQFEWGLRDMVHDLVPPAPTPSGAGTAGRPRPHRNPPDGDTRKK